MHNEKDLEPTMDVVTATRAASVGSERVLKPVRWQVGGKSRLLLNNVAPTLSQRMLSGPRDVGNGLDRDAIVVSLKDRTKSRQLLMRLQS